MVGKTSSLATHVQNMKQTAVFAGSKKRPKSISLPARQRMEHRRWKAESGMHHYAELFTGNEYDDRPAIDKCIKLVQKWDDKKDYVMMA